MMPSAVKDVFMEHLTNMTINSLNTNNMFGSTPLFGASTLPTFGTTNQNPFAQSSPFGQPNQPPNNAGLFGSANFNFGQGSQPPSAFSYPTPTNPFNQNANLSTNPYALGPSTRKGSSVKYSPVQETETVLRNGGSSLGRVRFCSITSMREYENTSFEELRFEDYKLGNKKFDTFGASNSASTLCGVSNHSFASSFASQIKPVVSNIPTLFRTPNTTNISSGFNSNNVFPEPSYFARTPTTSNNVFPGLPVSTNTNNTLFGSTNSTPLFGNNLFTPNSIKPFPLITSQKPIFPAETKRFSFDIQPSKSDSSMEACELRKQKPNAFVNQPITPIQTGFNWSNKPAQNIPPQPTFNFPNPTPVPFSAPNTAQQGLYSCPPQTQNFDLKSPPGIEGLRDMFRLTSPFGMSSLYNDLEVSNRRIENSSDFYQRSAEEILNRVDRGLKPIIKQPSEKVKDMYGLFKAIDESEPNDELKPRIKLRELRIKHEILPPAPLIIDPYINKQADTLLKLQEDAACSKLPASSDSPSVLTLPKEDSNADMHQVVSKNMTSGLYNSDDSEISICTVKSVDIKPSKVMPTVKPSCGITLTKPDYYTLPCLDDILKYVNPDGTCLIKGFTVGRVGFGNVHFPEPLDVSNLDLDRIVDIGYREITVYPDDEDKPPFGEGLNRRAQVTLDKIFPRREDGDLETDLENLKARHYEDTLRLISVRMDVDFVEYRPETGSWVFIVPHF